MLKLQKLRVLGRTSQNTGIVGTERRNAGGSHLDPIKYEEDHDVYRSSKGFSRLTYVYPQRIAMVETLKKHDELINYSR